MKPFHLLLTLRGDQDAQFALIRIDETAIANIRKARSVITGFSADDDGTASLRHIGPYSIHFLSELPGGFLPEHITDDPYSQLPSRLDDLDEDAFTEAAAIGKNYVRSETTGLLIYPEHFYLIGHEKHSSDEIEGDCIFRFVEELTRPEAPPADDLPTFTAWCCQANGGGTIHIASFEAADLNAAIEAGINTCMEDWDEENPANIHLLGIAAGDVEILHWNDINGGDM